MHDSYLGYFVFFALIISACVMVCSARVDNCATVCKFAGDKSYYTHTEGCFCLEKMPNGKFRPYNPRPQIEYRSPERTR